MSGLDLRPKTGTDFEMATRKPSDTIYRFKIEAYTPETMPMARLAEYMAELATMLGEPKSVHFQRLLPGSTVLVHRVEREAAPKVRERIKNVRIREAPAEALRAYQRVNKMLRDDNGVGALQERGATIIKFPGREQAEEKYPPIRQHGTIDGVIVGIGGLDQTVHIRLMIEDARVSGCWTDRAIAKRLALHLYEPVRLSGRGSWSREAEGGWTLTSFKIEGFEPLRDTGLVEALAELRAIPLQFGPGTLAELQMIRHGPPVRKVNGGH
jgi:hypothetical protein